MSGELGALSVDIGANNSKLTAGLGQAKAMIGMFAMQAGSMLAAVGVGLSVHGLVGQLKEAVGGFGDLEKKAMEVGTLLKDWDDTKLKAVSREAQDLSIKFGQTTEAMLGAKYDIVSSGFTNAADASFILAQGAKAAVGGITDAKTATKVLVAALNAYGMSASNAERVNDILFNTVSLGVTTFSELSASMGDVMPLAKAAGLSLEELSAAIASITLSGSNTQDAVTGIRALLNSIAAPSEQAIKAIHAMNMKFTDSKGKLLDLESVVRQFRGKNLAQVMDIVGEKMSAQAVLALANNLERFKDVLASYGNISGATDAAFKKMENTWDHHVAVMKASWHAFTQDIGGILAEGFTPAVEWLGKAFNVVRQMMQDNTEGVSSFLSAKIEAFGDFLGGFVDWIADLDKSASLDRWARHIVIGFTAVFEVGKMLVNGIKTAIAAITGMLTDWEKWFDNFNAKEDRREALALEKTWHTLEQRGSLGVNDLTQRRDELTQRLPKTTNVEQRKNIEAEISAINNAFEEINAKQKHEYDKSLTQDEKQRRAARHRRKIALEDEYKDLGRFDYKDLNLSNVRRKKAINAELEGIRREEETEARRQKPMTDDEMKAYSKQRAAQESAGVKFADETQKSIEATSASVKAWEEGMKGFGDSIDKMIDTWIKNNPDKAKPTGLGTFIDEFKKRMKEAGKDAGKDIPPPNKPPVPEPESGDKKFGDLAKVKPGAFEKGTQAAWDAMWNRQQPTDKMIERNTAATAAAVKENTQATKTLYAQIAENTGLVIPQTSLFT